MTTEEKAKRYDEALERYKAKQEYESQKVHEFIEYLFPELKESEDERIRKEIKDFFSRIMLGQENFLKEDYDWNTWLAWIEKQGENANFFNKIQIGDKVTRNRDGVLVNLSQLNRVAKPAERQQKPAWSEEPLSDIENRIINFAMQFHDNRMKPEAEWEDELKMLRDNIKIDPWSEEDNQMIKNVQSDYHNRLVAGIIPQAYHDKVISWLNSLKERVLPQPKQEWSEEDDKKLSIVVYAINKVKQNAPEEFETYGKCFSKKDYEEVESWLKSLRPQKQWKPSERQKEALLWCVVHLGGADKQTLGELLEELNKL